MAKVLIADDERAICDAFAGLLDLDGHKAIVASTGREAIQAFTRERPDVVFLDIQMPDISGLEALAAFQRQDPGVPVIIITAHGTVETAMQALKGGAFDYLGKPLELPQVRALIESALHRPGPETDDESDVSDERTRDRIIGTSKAMQEVFKMVSLLTTNDLTVLITGESGVGKDLIAHAIHANGSRSNEPYVIVNCAAIPEDLIEIELFGHKKGAFTGAHARRIGRFEAAGAGTIYLDDVSELPYQLQAKLLRVLEDRTCEPVGGNESIPVRARIITSTNYRFDREAESQPFRRDLYYRLSSINIRIPTLRERIGDIPELAQHFLERAARAIGHDVRSIEPQAMSRLQQHGWPGNVRELQHTIQRSVLTARRNILTLHDLVFDEPASQPPTGTDTATQLEKVARSALNELVNDTDAPNPQPYKHLVEQVERALVAEALARCRGNQVAASEMLGINRTTLRRKC